MPSRDGGVTVPRMPSPPRLRAPSLRWPLALLACAVAIGPAAATTFRLLSLDELVGHAAVVAVVEVRSLESVARDGRIETLARLEVSRSLKGSEPGAALDAVIPGGVVGEWGQHVAGAPGLAAGETRIVFLFRDARGAWRFVGLAQGALLVDRDDTRGEWLVRRALDARVVAPAPGGGLVDVPYLAEEPLEPYLGRVERLVRTGR